MMAKVRWPFQRDSGQIEVMVVNKVISTVWQVAKIKLSKTISLQDLTRNAMTMWLHVNFKGKPNPNLGSESVAQNIFKYKFIESIYYPLYERQW